jgi:hypothetical protein
MGWESFCGWKQKRVYPDRPRANTKHRSEILEAERNIKHCFGGARLDNLHPIPELRYDACLQGQRCPSQELDEISALEECVSVCNNRVAA